MIFWSSISIMVLLMITYAILSYLTYKQHINHLEEIQKDFNDLHKLIDELDKQVKDLHKSFIDDGK